MSESQKADQIAFHFYTKLFNVVSHARTTSPQPTRLDKWFNLETPDSDLFTKEARERYKSISLSPPPPPLEIQVLLTIPELSHNQVLVHVSSDSSRVRIDPTPRYVLLEEFVLHFIPAHTDADVPLPTIYKHGIPLFRSLYTLLRLLPVWKLHKRLRRRTSTGPSLGLTLRVRQATHDESDVLSLMTTSPVDTHEFPSVPHPLGSLALSATYLTNPAFQLDDLESLLSSRFLSLDQRPFTPTLAARNHLRSSSSTATTSPSSSPPGPNSQLLSRSPPRTGTSYPHTISTTGIPLPLPDRGNPRLPLTPPRLTPARPSSGPQSAHPALSGISSTRLAHLATTTSNMTSQHGLSSTSSLSPTNSFFANNPVTGGTPIPDAITSTSLAAASASTSATASGAGAGGTGGMTSRPSSRPQPQYPFPFKSNTVSGAGSVPVGSLGSSSSSPGLGLGLPSSLGSAGSGGIPSSSSERVGLGRFGERDRVVSLPQHALGGGGGGGGGGDAGSSLGAFRTGNGAPRMALHSRGSSVSGGGGGGGGGVIPMSRTSSARGREREEEHLFSGTSVPRKRYSSSFGHRYGSPQAGGGPGSLGSGGSSVGDEHNNKDKDKDKDKETMAVVDDRRRSIPAIPHYHQHSPNPHSPLSPHYSPSSSQMYLKAGNADDEDISMFVQDIDARKMLRGGASRVMSREVSRERGGVRVPLKSSPLQMERQLPPLESDDGDGEMRMVPVPVPVSVSVHVQAGRPMLTSEREVDEQLKRMNEAFLKSLEGLGGSGGQQSDSNGNGGGGGGGGHGHLRNENGRLSVGVGMGRPEVVETVRVRSLTLSGLGGSRLSAESASTSSGATVTPGGMISTLTAAPAAAATTGGPAGGIAIPKPKLYRRQGSSQEIVGRLETGAGAGDEGWGNDDDDETRAGPSRGVGGEGGGGGGGDGGRGGIRSGGRYYIF